MSMLYRWWYTQYVGEVMQVKSWSQVWQTAWCKCDKVEMITFELSNIMRHLKWVTSWEKGCVVGDVTSIVWWWCGVGVMVDLSAGVFIVVLTVVHNTFAEMMSIFSITDDIDAPPTTKNRNTSQAPHYMVHRLHERATISEYLTSIFTTKFTTSNHQHRDICRIHDLICVVAELLTHYLRIWDSPSDRRCLIDLNDIHPNGRSECGVRMEWGRGWRWVKAVDVVSWRSGRTHVPKSIENPRESMFQS